MPKLRHAVQKEKFKNSAHANVWRENPCKTCHGRSHVMPNTKIFVFFYKEIFLKLFEGVISVTDGTSRVQPACPGGWKMCKKEEQIVVLM
jgi:hypothetical protein